MKRALVSASAVVISLASATPVTIDETSAFIQQAAELHFPKAYRRPKEVCSVDQLAEFEARNQKYQEKLAAVSQAREAAAQAEFSETMTRLSRSIADFSKPLLSMYPQNAKLIANLSRPMLSQFLKFVTMHFAKPQTNYSSVPQTIDIGALTQDVLDRIRGAAPDEQQIVGKALAEFNELVDERAKAEFPELAKELTRMPSVPGTWEEIGLFMAFFVAHKAVPFLIAEAFPSTSKILSVFMQKPDDESKLMFWFRNTLMPALPESCRKAESLLEVYLGKQDSAKNMPKQLSLFKDTVTACSADFLPTQSDTETILKAKKEVPPLPTKKCQLCEEYYTKKRPECGMRCAPMMFSCVKSGLTTVCLHDVAPCLACFTENLRGQDECEGKQSHEGMLARLDALKKALRDGTVEVSGVEKFSNDVSKALLRMQDHP